MCTCALSSQTVALYKTPSTILHLDSNHSSGLTASLKACRIAFLCGFNDRHPSPPLSDQLASPWLLLRPSRQTPNLPSLCHQTSNGQRNAWVKDIECLAVRAFVKAKRMSTLAVVSGDNALPMQPDTKQNCSALKWGPPTVVQAQGNGPPGLQGGSANLMQTTPGRGGRPRGAACMGGSDRPSTTWMAQR